MGVKTSAVSPFVNTITLMQMRRKKDQKNAASHHANTFNHLPTDSRTELTAGFLASVHKGRCCETLNYADCKT